MESATLGFRVHSGWAVAVALCGPLDSPMVVDRRRIQLVKIFTYFYRQPYHTAERMPREQAAKFVASVRSEATRLTLSSLQSLVTELGEKNQSVVGSALLLASGRALPELEQILASHALIHTADGELFRDALRAACASSHLRLEAIREKELFETAAKRLGIGTVTLKDRIALLGKTLGPPWTEDEKLAALAAWLALAAR